MTITSDINVYLVVIPKTIRALALGLKKGIQRQKAIYDTYELSVDDGGINR